MELTHLNQEGSVRMVDVTGKRDTERIAVAKGAVTMCPETLRLIVGGGAPKEPDASLPKGDVLTTAQIAGIMGAKRTPELIPLCHPLSLTSVDVDFEIDTEGAKIEITAMTRCTGRTGVEMEALVAVSVAALTIYDMAKAMDRTMQIGQIRLVRKSGGRSGHWRLEDEEGTRKSGRESHPR